MTIHGIVQQSYNHLTFCGFGSSWTSIILAGLDTYLGGTVSLRNVKSEVYSMARLQTMRWGLKPTHNEGSLTCSPSPQNSTTSLLDRRIHPTYRLDLFSTSLSLKVAIYSRERKILISSAPSTPPSLQCGLHLPFANLMQHHSLQNYYSKFPFTIPTINISTTLTQNKVELPYSNTRSSSRRLQDLGADVRSTRRTNNMILERR